MVMKVKELIIYPIKSFPGLHFDKSDDSLIINEHGFYLDRCMIFYNHKTKRFVSYENEHRFANFLLSKNDEHIEIRWDNELLGKINIKQITRSEPRLINEQTNLVKMGNRKATSALVDGELSRNMCKKLGYDPTNFSLQYFVQQQSAVVSTDKNFQSRCQFLVVSLDSVRSLLKKHLNTEPSNELITIYANRYRANIIIESNEDIDCGFIENEWTEIQLGNIRFTDGHPCGRCRMVDIENTREGKKLDNFKMLPLLQELNEKRQAFFGMYFAVKNNIFEKKINVNDVITVNKEI
ncbi:hypothetical protein SNEBB_009673 [Seison nebaliae]|nr:hypothetical protein SNEBB_009673 [Seison nebaliae]